MKPYQFKFFELTDEMYFMYKKNGTQHQLDLLQEECAELIQAISKVRRYGIQDIEIKRNLYEEIGDVLICIDSFVNFTKSQEYVRNFMAEKIERLRKKIDDTKTLEEELK